jgi:hypothetical protein
MLYPQVTEITRAGTQNRPLPPRAQVAALVPLSAIAASRS